MDEAPRDLTIRCACGDLSLTAAAVHPAVANRVACYCDGCQAFARRMGHPEILDADGGTERFQISPASLSITRGREHLACMQQTARGAFRWYARCCGTPLALTLAGPGVPFVGVDAHRVVQVALEGGLTGALGPVRARVNGHFRGAEARSRRADLRSLLAMLWHLVPLTFRWWRQGDHKRSPFFDASTGQPVVTPERAYALNQPLLRTAGCR